MAKTDEEVRRKLSDKVGDWLLDIAKYILTAVIITAIFGGIVNKVWLIVIGLVSVGAIFSAGLVFVKNGKQNK